jgi:crotonobetainyl-CoA:carnitine CoA-transferase CaiB-like acyl-CoA transferase
VARGRERGDAGGFATVRALADLHVVEVGGDVAAAYCTRLLADLGADVVKVEPPHGDPLRWWGPFPGDRVDPDESGLFRALNTSKRNVHVSLSEWADAFLELVRGADLVVESLGPGTLERLGLGPSELSAATDSLVVVRISVAGQHGPYRDRPLTDLMLQAMGGWVSAHGLPGRSQVRVGGRLAELTVGSFAAAAGAVIAARDLREPVVVDVSMLECLVGTLAYPMLFNEMLKALGLSPPDERHATLPAIVRARDGWVGINCLTGRHWQDVCAMVGLDEFAG